jgi:hypothetical protein
MSIKEIALDDKIYSEIFIGQRVLKKEVFQSTGKIPLYSSNVFKPFGFLETPNMSVPDFNHNYVLWGIDGNFEFNVKRKGEKFAITDHCGAIKLLNEAIVPDYVAFQLESKHKLELDRSLRASLSNMRHFKVAIPLNSKGEFDHDKQQGVADRIAALKRKQSELRSQIDDLKEAIVEVESSHRTKLVSVEDVFGFPKTNSGITREFCLKNKGDVPVYGCSKTGELVLGYIRPNIKGVRYYHDSLAWNRNGWGLGRFFYRQGQFTTNEDHRVLTIKPQYSEILDPPFLSHVLQTEVRKRGFGYARKLGKKNIQEVEFEVPIDDEGGFDLQAQRKLAKRYERFSQIKDELIEQLEQITEANLGVSWESVPTSV